MNIGKSINSNRWISKFDILGERNHIIDIITPSLWITLTNTLNEPIVNATTIYDFKII